MTTTYEGSIDEINALFFSEWKAKTAAVVGYIPPIEWFGVINDTPIDKSGFWVRVSTQMIDSPQKTLCENVVTLGSRRYEPYGLVFIQLFAPKTKEAVSQYKKLAMIAQNIFRLKTNNVTFRNSTIKELPLENGAIRVNIIAHYEFDEVK